MQAEKMMNIIFLGGSGQGMDDDELGKRRSGLLVVSDCHHSNHLPPDATEGPVNCDGTLHCPRKARPLSITSGNR
jgi:hypothetical protein